MSKLSSKSNILDTGFVSIITVNSTGWSANRLCLHPHWRGQISNHSTQWIHNSACCSNYVTFPFWRIWQKTHNKSPGPCVH